MGLSFQRRAASGKRGVGYATIAWRWESTNGNGMEVKETGSFRGRLALGPTDFPLRPYRVSSEVVGRTMLVHPGSRVMEMLDLLGQGDGDLITN